MECTRRRRNKVRIAIVRNNLLGLQEIRVIDNGTGMPYQLGEETFRHMGGSWKRQKLRTPNGRLLHGKEGRGRFKAFALGTHVKLGNEVPGRGPLIASLAEPDIGDQLCPVK